MSSCLGLNDDTYSDFNIELLLDGEQVSTVLCN